MEIPRRVSKGEALKESAKNIFKWAGKVIKGNTVLVPVSRHDYEYRILPFVGTTLDHSTRETSADVVKDALYHTPQSVEEAEMKADYFDLPLDTFTRDSHGRWQAPALIIPIHEMGRDEIEEAGLSGIVGVEGVGPVFRLGAED